MSTRVSRPSASFQIAATIVALVSILASAAFWLDRSGAFS